VKRVLILVENLPSPFDRRVWQEASTLRDAGYGVSIVCPTGKGCEEKFASIDGIDIWRYDLTRRRVRLATSSNMAPRLPSHSFAHSGSDSMSSTPAIRRISSS